MTIAQANPLFNFEIPISLPAGTIVLQDWGPKDAPVILCLHGWLDNLASFYPLAEHLSHNFHLLLIDFPGHGQSNPLPEGGHYYIWQNVELLHQLLQQQGLGKVHLLGHSMGGVVASLFAGSFSDKVESLMLLDSLGPMVDSNENSPKQLAKAILDGQRLISPLRIFPRLEDAVVARKKSSPGMTDTALLPIVERNLAQVEGGYSWSTDSRLRQQSKVRLTEKQVEAFFNEIKNPVLLIVAEQGIIPSAWLQKRKAYLNNVQQVNITGHHHFHTEASGAYACANFINDFIQPKKST
jgi:pimeloyl-ACP methyl ester carboxylesterase